MNLPSVVDRPRAPSKDQSNLPLDELETHFDNADRFGLDSEKVKIVDQILMLPEIAGDDSKKVYWLLRKFDALANLKSYKMALEILNRILRSRFDDQGLLRRQAGLLLKLAREERSGSEADDGARRNRTLYLTKAEDTINRVIRLEPPPARGKYATYRGKQDLAIKADIIREKGDLYRAEKVIDASLADYPYPAANYFEQAKIRRDLNKVDEALISVIQSIIIQPTDFSFNLMISIRDQILSTLNSSGEQNVERLLPPRSWAYRMANEMITLGLENLEKSSSLRVQSGRGREVSQQLADINNSIGIFENYSNVYTKAKILWSQSFERRGRQESIKFLEDEVLPLVVHGLSLCGRQEPFYGQYKKLQTEIKKKLLELRTQRSW